MHLHRLLLILLIVCCHRSYGQRLTVHINNAPLDSVVRVIAGRAGYLYTIRKESVLSRVRVSVSVEEATVSEAMDSCLGRLPVYYDISGRPVRSINVYAGCYVWGEVVDGEGRGIEGATVLSQEGSERSATQTDDRGQFHLRLLDSVRTVVISHVGYEARSYTVRGSKELRVSLDARAGELSGVVVHTNGFEEIPAERATGSYGYVSGEELRRRPSASVLDRLDGVTGSYLVNKNVAAGTNQSAIAIRGRSTIFSNPDPLVVVNDFPYSGQLDNINPEDIESVSVLKDAAAASVWGTRAANGVIVIRTRKGRYGQGPRLSASSAVTVGARPDVYYQPQLSSSQYIEVQQFLFGQGYYDNLPGSATHPVIAPAVEVMLAGRAGDLSPGQVSRQLDSLRGLDTRRDISKYWYQRGVSQQYWLGLTGGGPGQRYALSAGLDHDRSPLARNGYQRVTLSGEHGYRLVPGKLELTSSFALTSSKSDLNNEGILSSYPYLSLVGPHGQAQAAPWQLRGSYLDTVGGGRLLDWHYRPYDELRQASDVAWLTDLRINEGLHYNLGRAWRVDALYQYGQGDGDRQQLQGVQTFYTRNLINSFTQVGPGGELSYPIPVGGILDETWTSYRSHNGRLQAAYHPLTDIDHDLHVLAGWELQSVHSRNRLARTYGYNEGTQTGSPVSSYATPYQQYYSSSSSMKIPYPDNGFASDDHYWSYYVNGGYRYLQRYTITGSARLDQSNLWGVDMNHKSIPLWSAGLSWELSRESFYQAVWLPFLRLRVSDGCNGNVYKNVSGYTTTSVFPFNAAGISNGNLNPYGSAYASITNPPNPHLRWERVNVFNAGIDFAVQDSVLQGSVEYYTKHGQYLIGPSGLDPTTGNTQYTGNVASMTARGIDINLHLQVGSGKVRYNSNLLFNIVRDKVTRYLVQPPTIAPFLNSAQINPLAGRPLYSLYALGFAGLDAQAGNPQGWLNGQVSQDYASMYKSTNYGDLVYKGPVNPPVFGSWRHTISYGALGLSINIVYKLGHYFLRPSINYYTLYQGTSLGHPDYALRWQHPGDELHTSVPSMIYGTTSVREAFYNSSTVLAEKGDLLRLQDVQLYYDLSKRTIPWLPVRSLRVYGYANNVGLLWTANHRGIDPDAVSGMPEPRTLAVGVRMDF